ncbi:MAG: flagellar type III secretion system pore protein FliP [Planctomycetota bacterium]|jgi:flagellar biosynthetic protein FliP
MLSLGATSVSLPLVMAAMPAAPMPPINPISVLEEAGAMLPGSDGSLSGALEILLLLTVLSLVPSIVILCTCFTRMIIVLALLRQALGTQSLPPSQVITGLALLLSAAVMTPTVDRMYEEGLRPYMDGELSSYEETWDRVRQPLREFMLGQIEATGNWSGVYMMLNYRGIDTSDPESLTYDDVDMLTLVPAYILSELKVAFLMGFRVYLPFLVIDLVIASLLISMGMLMLPPVLISLPFKLLLFVLVDGWQLVVGSLLESVVAVPGGSYGSAALGAASAVSEAAGGPPLLPGGVP